MQWSTLTLKWLFYSNIKEIPKDQTPTSISFTKRVTFTIFYTSFNTLVCQYVLISAQKYSWGMSVFAGIWSWTNFLDQFKIWTDDSTRLKVRASPELLQFILRGTRMCAPIFMVICPSRSSWNISPKAEDVFTFMAREEEPVDYKVWMSVQNIMASYYKQLAWPVKTTSSMLFSEL